jgi:hypothetical protein
MVVKAANVSDCMAMHGSAFHAYKLSPVELLLQQAPCFVN